MKQRHIAFAVEQAYGHILPTLGIAMELIRRGHRVSYAVTKDFAPGITRIGASAFVFSPIVTRPDILESIRDGDQRRFEGLRQKKTENSLRQLDGLYSRDGPDLIIHDACEDVAGRSLAMRRGLPHIRVSPLPVKFDDATKLESEFPEDSVVLVCVPGLFCGRVSEESRGRVKIIGFIAEGRAQFFDPWKPRDDGRRTILISVTTGILPQIEFCKMAIGAFRDEPVRVVLSIGGLDPVSKIAVTDLGDLPENIDLNQGSANFDILQYASLFITQGGQGSVLEALHRGVPILGIPSYFWDEDTCRIVAESGLGVRLPFTEASPDSLRERAKSLLRDHDTLSRVKAFQQRMQEDGGAEVAADVVEEYLSGNM